MTKQTRKSDSQLRGLKWLLATGSLVAALMGSRVLATNEVVNTAAIQPETTIVMDQPQAETGNVQFRPKRIELAPIPSVATPFFQPMVRSRSSR